MLFTYVAPFQDSWHEYGLTLRLPNKLSSANFFSATSIFKVLQFLSKLVKMFSRCDIIKQLGSRWDAKLLRVSSESKLFAYVTLVVIGRLRVINADMVGFLHLKWLYSIYYTKMLCLTCLNGLTAVEKYAVFCSPLFWMISFLPSSRRSVYLEQAFTECGPFVVARIVKCQTSLS